MSKPRGSLLEIFRTLRSEARAASAVGHDWRDVVDALRPWTSELWRVMSPQDRRQFLRHIRPYWEVHRHRLAPSVADTLAVLERTGQLTVVAGYMTAIEWKNGLFEVTVRPRGARAHIHLSPAWIVNCTGPQGDYARSLNPLVSGAVKAGILHQDDLQLGLDVTEHGAIIDAHGVRSSNIVALGPPTRGLWWEVTAVPDIRGECARMAAILLQSQ
jgi:uncharacterized NAD(P)/FAD-binding protein YdhS